MDKDTTDRVFENIPDTQPILDPDVQVEAGTEVQQLPSSTNRKLPSKSCCKIIGIVALFCLLVGVAIFTVYEGKVPDPVDWFQSRLGPSKKFYFDGSPYD